MPLIEIYSGNSQPLAHFRPKGAIIHFSPAYANNTTMVGQSLITKKVVQSRYEFTLGEVTRGAEYYDGAGIWKPLCFTEIISNGGGIFMFIENVVRVHLDFYNKRESSLEVSSPKWRVTTKFYHIPLTQCYLKALRWDTQERSIQGNRPEK